MMDIHSHTNFPLSHGLWILFFFFFSFEECNPWTTEGELYRGYYRFICGILRARVLDKKMECFCMAGEGPQDWGTISLLVWGLVKILVTEIRVKHGKEGKLVSLVGPIRMHQSVTSSQFPERCQGTEASALLAFLASNKSIFRGPCPN